MKLLQITSLFVLLLSFKLLFAVTPFTLKGVVINEKNNKPIAHVSVFIPQTHQGAITDTNGYFEIKLPKGKRTTLFFKCMGYKAQTYTVDECFNSKTTLLIALQEENIQLEAVTIHAINKQKQLDISTKTFTKPENLSLQVVTIGKEDIESMGSRRLDNVLQEIPGIAMVPDPSGGSSNLGVQIQGMDGSYTSVMIDGQPLIGRDEKGNLDLSKIALNNIEKLELVKGATGTIYGSNAMAGVINITTKVSEATKVSGTISAKYGSNNTSDFGGFFHFPLNDLSKSYLSVSANYYKTDGFDADISTSETTLPAYSSGSITLKLSNNLTQNDQLTTQLNFNTKESENVVAYTGKNVQNNINSSVTYKYFFSPKQLVQLNYFFSDFSFNRKYVNGISTTMYAHVYNQVEAISNVYLGKSNATIGAGIRLDNSNAIVFKRKPYMKNYYAFAQTDVLLAKGLNSIVGLRYEGFNMHPNAFTLQVGFNYKPFTWANLKANFSTGYKVPDFRKSFMIFDNGAYVVIGSSVLKKELEIYENQYFIGHNPVHDEYTKQLQPEVSKSINVSTEFKHNNTALLNIGVFYNKIDNLIFEGLVDVLKETGTQIFSYKNIKQAYTAGIELNGNYNFKRFKFSFGYQYLNAKNLEKLEAIKQGSLEIRNNQGFGRVAMVSDYFNLPFRSRHMANCKLFYNIPSVNTKLNIRVNYRGKYGIQDRNFKNGFIDRYDLFVNAYTLLNVGVEKHFFNNTFKVQFTADNLLDHTNAFVPALIGRQFFTSLKYNF